MVEEVLRIQSVIRDNVTDPKTGVVHGDPGARNWVYPDFPRFDLKQDSMPRAGIWVLDRDSVSKVISNVKHLVTTTFQIEFVVMKAKGGEGIFTIGGEKYSDMKLLYYLASQVENVLISYQTDLSDSGTPQMFNYTQLGKFVLGHNEQTHQMRLALRVSYQSFDTAS